VKYLQRFYRLPWENLLFFSIFSILFFICYRFVFPMPASWFLPNFLFQFGFGFLPQLYSRKFGRIYTACGAILLARSSWILDANPQFHLNDLAGLFLGSIFGILFREILLVFSGSGEMPLPKQSDQIVTQWLIRNPLAIKQPSLFFYTPTYFLFWLMILFLCTFLQGFGFSFLHGLGVPEFFYLNGISSRTFLSVPMGILTSVSLPILYFFAEERFGIATNRESLRKHLFFGIFIGFCIQLFVISMQTIFLPSFLIDGSGSSFDAKRYPGLYLDSGSSSWILPTLSLVFIYFLHGRYKKTRESFVYLLVFLLLFLVTYLGFHQAKTFWVIWTITLLIFCVMYLSGKWIKSIKLVWAIRGISFLLLPILLVTVLWSFSKLSKESKLGELGNKYLSFQTSMLEKKGMDSLKDLDQTRGELIQISWENFHKSPWFGNGLGSLPILLKDQNRSGTKLNSELIDLPPNFVLAILHDHGIFGTIFVFLLIALLVWERSSYISLLLLVLPLQFGMMVQHGDGAFVALFLLFYPLTDATLVTKPLRYTNWFRFTVIIICLGVPLHYFLFYTEKLIGQGIGSEFRKKEIGSYQIQVSIPALGNIAHHQFFASTIEWKLANGLTNKFKDLNFMADGENIQIKLIWKNAKRETILESLTEKAFRNTYGWGGKIPPDAEYVVVKISGTNHVFVSKFYFNSSGELKL